MNDRQRDKYLQKNFGITLETYNSMLMEQEGVCFICKRPPKSMALAVDHNHQTGEVRGLLCYRCNKFTVGGLERMHKKPRTILERVVEYFKRYRMKGDL